MFHSQSIQARFGQQREFQFGYSSDTRNPCQIWVQKGSGMDLIGGIVENAHEIHFSAPISKKVSFWKRY